MSRRGARLNAESEAFLGQVRALGLKSGTIEEIRARYRILTQHFAGTPPDVVETRQVGSYRWYSKQGSRDTLVWLHGGRFISGDLDTHDSLCRMLAAETGWAVMAVDYRLAPEHQFPAALEDSVEAVGRALDEAASEERRVAMGGDSAGAALALAAALEISTRRPGALEALVLAYPMIDAECGSVSYGEFATGPGPPGDDMRQGWAHYLGKGVDPRDERVSPLYSGRLAALPRCLLWTAGVDPLRDEGLDLASRMAESGVELRHEHLPRMIHGFLTYPAAFPDARRFATQAGVLLRGR